VQSISDPMRIMVFGTVEMTPWDLRGKELNQPLYQLLGGAEGDFLNQLFLSARRRPQGPDEKTPDEVVDYCVALHETNGTTFFEGKFSTPDPKQWLRMLELIRARLGDHVMLRIDSNQAYSLATARRLARLLEELGVGNWEKRVPTLSKMIELRHHRSILFSTDNADIGGAMDHKIRDAICGNPAVLGGIGRLLRFIDASEHSGIDFWCYSDSSIASAAHG
jgi:glucarate dehydratase